LKILAVDTSSPTIALGYSDETQHMFVNYTSSRNHSAVLASLIRTLLSFVKVQVRDIDIFACGIGPGGLTGLRVGIATVQGMAIAHEKKVLPVVSSQALAMNLSSWSGEIAIARKARSGYVYMSCYHDNECILKPSIYAISQVREKILSFKKPMVLGDAKSLFADVAELAPRYLENVRAENLVEIARSSPEDALISPELLEPLYLQKSIAEINFEKRQSFSS